MAPKATDTGKKHGIGIAIIVGPREEIEKGLRKGLPPVAPKSGTKGSKPAAGGRSGKGK